jgi:DNA repair exonuclease SbcCD ATPase subunit
LTENQIKTQKKYINDITTLNDDFIEKRNTDISNLISEREELENDNEICQKFIDENQKTMQEELDHANDKKQALLQYQAQFQTKIKRLVKESKFYEQNETCPTCTQSIDESVRSENLKSAKTKAKEFQQAMDHGLKESAAVEQIIERYTELAEKIRQQMSTISSNNNTITRFQRQVQSYQNELKQLSDQTGDLSKANIELKDLEEKKETSNNTRYEINESHTYNNVMGEMLKDTGIKTKVIKQYLPVINNLVNKYLQTLDFFVHFDLDESFQETIRSRHRDAFSYDSFSEGEKQRIDLALLFTWRMIAKMKNSVATNLLILDETFDSSLDHDGVDNLMKILYTLGEDTNVFVISHKGEILDGKFENRLEFYKEKNFSRMK